MMRKIQKRLSFFMVMIMVCSLIFTMPVRAENNTDPMTEDDEEEKASAEDLQIGDYVQMGSYWDDPILWRCVDIDENGPLMLSDKILCLKTFDAPGNNTSGSHGRVKSREEYGSNYWKDSNIRMWLNSDAEAGDIAWSCDNPPDENNTEHNAYADEAGFLNAFTVLEKGVMKSVVQKSLLAAADKNITGAKGSGFHKYNEIIYSVDNSKLVYESILENYDEAYYEEVEDKVFLLDVKQIQSVFNHTPQLGLWYHIGKLTEKAVENNEEKSSLIQAGKDWYNWLRSPYVNDEGNQCSVRHVSRNGQIGCSMTKSDDIGIRPAFYIKEDTEFPEGDGSVDTPYLLVHTHTLKHYDGTAATCTESGTGEYWKCEGTGSCGKMFSDENGTVEITDVPEVKAKGHKYGKWEITTVPTLQAKGEAVRVCGNDESHKETKELPVLTDTNVWTAGERKEPTETNPGSQQYTSEFGTVTITIPATGHIHKLIHHDVEAATCTKPGTGEYWKCEGTGSCGKMFSDGNGTVEITAVPAGDNAKGHSYGKWEITTVPSLEAKGEAVRVCGNDGSHKETKELPVLTDTNVWTAGERKEPTQTEPGSQQYTSEFGIVTITIPATAHIHKLIHHDGTAATCTEPGTGEYWKCEGTGSCGKMFSDGNGTVEITDVPAGENAKGHNYGKWEITTVPTSQAKGEAVHVCQNDGSHKETKELPVLTDTNVWTAGERKEPTKTEPGSQQYTSEFGIVTVTIPATGSEPPLPSEDEEEDKEHRELALNAKLKVSQVGRNINISWGRLPNADGYHVYVQYCGKKFNDKSLNQVIGADNTSITVKKVNGKKLDLKKNYKIYVEAYKLSDGKKKILGKSIIAHIVGKNNKKYTNVKKVKVKKDSYTLKQGSTVTIQAEVVLVSKGKKQLSNAHARQFRYASSDKKIATVSKNGKVRAAGKGSCIIYVYARNGYAKEVKITVK